MLTFSPIALGVVVTGVGQAVRDELITSGGGDVNRVCLAVPGEIAWDACECGQLAQSITATTPSIIFPTPATDQRVTACGPALVVVNVILSVTRCVTVMTPNSAQSPACDVLLGEALTLERDRYAVARGVTCYLRQLKENFVITDYAVGGTTSVGPAGGCAGVQLTYQFGVLNVCC
jgi:hypothetical protein